LNEHYSEWHSLLDVRQGGATEPLGGMGETAVEQFGETVKLAAAA